MEIASWSIARNYAISRMRNTATSGYRVARARVFFKHQASPGTASSQGALVKWGPVAMLMSVHHTLAAARVNRV